MKWYDINLPNVDVIKERLQIIIPENVEDANYARNIVAARTIFVMLYSYSIEGEAGKIRPTTVTVMNNDQAKKITPEERKLWLTIMQSRKKPVVYDSWYKENTRESIRDDTISTLKKLGAVDEIEGIPTTSSKPRYYLSKDFAELFNPMLTVLDMQEKIMHWQAEHLHRGAMILQELRDLERRSVVEVDLGTTKRSLAPGPSSVLTKVAVEVFAKKFLSKPEVLLLSESAEKVHWQFGDLLEKLGLAVNPKKSLPDLIIADIGTKKFLLVFIEIVHSDGPISGARKEDLLELAKNSGLTEDYCAFVSVFASRSASAYKKVQGSLAWGSFVWFADEPDRLIHLVDNSKTTNAYISNFL